MRVCGIDFTSRPRRSKPITRLEARLEGSVLRAGAPTEWHSFEDFEAALRAPGPWIAGIDFPFGQARRFVKTIGWPRSWAGYVRHTRALGREGFRRALDAYRKERAEGDKEHRRATDVDAGSISPQKLYGTPIGLMFFEGAWRLLEAGVTIPGLHRGDPERIVVEAYPGVLARAAIGRKSYKNDQRKKQSDAQCAARRELLAAVTGGALVSRYGLEVIAPAHLADDPGGDHLDALLCAVQAAWAWRRRDRDFGMPRGADPREGWIADPMM